MADDPLIDGLGVGKGHRVWAAIVTVVLAMAAMICLPHGGLRFQANPGFVPALDVPRILVEGITAGLLLNQAQLSRQRRVVRLGAAYLFSALITTFYVLAFPGVIAAAPLTGTSGSAIWFWSARHGGFAFCVLFYVHGQDAVLGQYGIASAALLTIFAAGALAMIATIGLPWLPLLIRDGNYSGLVTGGVGPGILLLTLVAGFLVLFRLRCREMLSLWLTVAMFAACLDVELTLSGTSEFTLGWYMARAVSLLAALTVLFALLCELMQEAGRVARANAQLEQMLQTDVLTGLANRRAFEQALDAEWRRAQREQTSISLLMIDIDCFKGFNDRYGHPAGDQCIRSVANALVAQAYRPADIAARIGGEEFAIILPVTEESGARQVAERLRLSVVALNLTHEGSETGFVTISVGAATIRPYAVEESSAQLVSWADHALYRAKTSGRNTIRSSNLPPLALERV